MKLVTKEDIKQLVSLQGGTCISLYQPTHRNHPENQQDPVRFRQLIKRVEDSLQKTCSEAEIRSLLKPFEALLKDTDFWNHTPEGVVVFASPQTFQVYGVQRSLNELAVVASTFHVKPLKKYLQTVNRFQILCLNRQDIKLYEGNRHYLDELELAEDVPRTISEALGKELTEEHLTVASYGGAFGNAPNVHGHGGKSDEVDKDVERFFRVVDRAIMERYSKPSGLPLVLASLPEYQSEFAKVSHNAMLLEEGIKVNPSSLTKDQLREKAWEIMEPQYLDQLDRMIAEYTHAASKNLGSDILRDVAKAAAEGRVSTLLIEEDRIIPGKIFDDTGKIKLEDLEHPEIDDLLDDLSELVEKMGGEVKVIPADRMPVNTGVAASFRY